MIPENNHKYFLEKIVYLPNYLVNDSKELLPKNNNNINTIDTFNNSMKKMKELTDDLFEKNKTLQECKNNLYKWQK